MLYIRADGNNRIGAGHLMRCLSIADAAAKLGMQILFLVADEQSIPLIQSRGYHSKVLHTDYTRPEEELPLLEKILQEDAQAFVLVDSYFVDQRYLKTVKQWSKTAFLEDFGEKSYDADFIINYNIYGPKLPYLALYRERTTRLLLGSSYAPLRQNFADAEYIVKDTVDNILITTGGADCYNVAGQLAERLIQKAGVDAAKLPQIHIVSGPFHGFWKQLEELSAEYDNVRVHENVEDMAALMASCDLAVSAAGSTLYELCAIGVPTVYFYFVDNQELPARYFAMMTQMRHAGNYVQDTEGTLERLTKECVGLLQSAALRRDISKSMQAVTDGRGAERIVQAIRSNAFLQE